VVSDRTAIASRKLLATDKNGHEFELTVAVGEPYQISESEWACPASIEGLHGRFPDMHGVDSWQAMQLAYQIAAQTLVDFVDNGGRLFGFEEREPVTPRQLFPDLAGRG
jgi:hypothetical protein